MSLRIVAASFTFSITSEGIMPVGARRVPQPSHQASERWLFWAWPQITGYGRIFAFCVANSSSVSTPRLWSWASFSSSSVELLDPATSWM